MGAPAAAGERQCGAELLRDEKRDQQKAEYRGHDDRRHEPSFDGGGRHGSPCAKKPGAWAGLFAVAAYFWPDLSF
jgi:hypothetical protein